MTKKQFKQALKEFGNELGLDLSKAPIPEDTDTDYEVLLNVTKAIFGRKIDNIGDALNSYDVGCISSSLDEDTTEECDNSSKQENSECEYNNLADLANTAILGALKANYYKLLEDPLGLKPEQLVALAKLQSAVSEA